VSHGQIAIDDPRAADVRALLAVHLTFARAQTPPEDAHAIDVDGLLDPAVTFFSYRAGDTLLAIGALKQLDPRHGEIKSMHTARAARGRGVGGKMLEHLITVSRPRAARAVFEPCEPFGDYRASRNSTYMTLRLAS